MPKLKFGAPPPPVYLSPMASTSGPPPPAPPPKALLAQRAGGCGAFEASVEEPLTIDGSPTRRSELKFRHEADRGFKVRRKKFKDAEMIATMERSANRSETISFGSFSDNYSSRACFGSGLSSSSSRRRAAFPVTSELPSSVEHGAPSPVLDSKEEQKLRRRDKPVIGKPMPSPKFFGFMRRSSAKGQSFK